MVESSPVFCEKIKEGNMSTAGAQKNLKKYQDDKRRGLS